MTRPPMTPEECRALALAQAAKDDPDARGGKPDAGALATALGYLARGWTPIPVPFKEKAPKIKGWPTLGVTLETAHQWFNGEALNIGVQLGAASGGLTDIDLDCPEAILAGCYLLPATLVFGRASKRHSHHLYITTLAAEADRASIPFPNPLGKDPPMLAELRIGGGSAGAQTIFPGSTHKSGELITWEADNPPTITVIDGSELKKWFAWIGVCTALAIAYPKVGGRHEGALIIGGCLARCGFSIADVNRFADALGAASSQAGDKRKDMVRAACDAAESYRAGRPTFGLPKLKEVFGEPIAKCLTKWLGYKSEVVTVGGVVRPSNGDGPQVQFIRGDGGQILRAHPDNARLAIASVGVSLKLNQFSTETEVAGLDGFGPELTDAGAVRLHFLIGERFGFLPPLLMFERVVVDVAHQNRFHPVREWLDGLEWDGTPRIDNWLREYSGAEDTAFNRAVGRTFLVAAVRRVRRPGCKFDTMVVFESRQGLNKSTALRTLAVRDEWFTDNLSLDADIKEVIEQTRGVWIVESSDLTGFGRKDIAHLKSFLSKQEDRARPAYGRRTERVPRQFIVAGSTNDPEYLADDENRRFWPVEIEQFDTGRLERDRAQLWAEAAHYENDGEPITLQQDLWEVAAEIQSEREFENPFYSVLAEKFDGQNGWVKSSTVWEAIGIPRERQKQNANQVGKAMRKLGFKRKQITKSCEKGARGERYYKSETGTRRLKVQHHKLSR